MAYPSVNYDVLSPVKFLVRSADVFPEKEAVVYNDIRHTYAQFIDRVYRLANGLKQRGIAKATRWPSSAPTPRPCSRRTMPCP